MTKPNKKVVKRVKKDKQILKGSVPLADLKKMNFNTPNIHVPEKVDDPRRILIFTPTTGLVRMEWVQARYSQIIPTNWSYVEMQQFLNPWISIGHQLADAQNLMAKEVVEGDYQFVIYIEHDNILPPDGFLRFNQYINEQRVPVVCGLYFLKSDITEPLIYRGRGTSHFTDWKLGDKVWCDGLPFGFRLEHAGLIKEAWKTSPEITVNGVKTREVFKQPNSIWMDEETGRMMAKGGTTDLEWCFPGDTIVVGKHSKPIKDIVPGDEVYTANGNLKKVTKLFQRQYTGKLSLIYAKRSQLIKMTPNHEVLVKKGNKAPQWVTAEQVEKGDYVSFPRVKTETSDYLEVQNFVSCELCPNGLPHIKGTDVALELYNSGFSTNQIAEAYGVDQKTVSLRIKELNGSLRLTEETKKISKNKQTENIQLEKTFCRLGLKGESKVIPARIPLNEEVMRFFGLYIAEGHSYANHAEFNFGKHEKHLVDFVSMVGKKYFFLHPYVLERDSCFSVNFASPVFAELVKKMFGSMAENKNIDRYLLLSSNNLLSALLGGYFEGDGHYHTRGNKLTATTVSSSLAYTLKIALAKLGYHSSVIKQNTAGVSCIQGRIVNTLDSYIISVSNAENKEMLQKFGLFDDAENGVNCTDIVEDDYIWVKVLKTEEELYSGSVYNIEVEDEHTYVTEFGVHNCTRIIEEKLLAKAGFPEFQKRKYPFLCDTKIFVKHIDQNGVMWPKSIPARFIPDDPKYKGKEVN